MGGRGGIVDGGDHQAPGRVIGGGGGARLDWVDVARGIGIIAVVVGHVWTRGPVRDALYSFHMPLFFLLSGLLSRPHPPGLFAGRLLLAQMRPYLAFLVLLVLIDQIVEPLQGRRPIFHDWPADLAVLAYGGSALRGPYTIFWFVPCLMVARIVQNMVLARWPDPLGRAQVVLAVLVLGLAYAVGHWTHVSPLGLGALPMALFLLWVGAAWRTTRWRMGMIVPLALLSFAGLAGLVPTLNMKAAFYGWPLLSIGAAIATSLLIFRLSAAIAPRASWLAALGRGSLVVMYLHVALIHYLSPWTSKPVLAAIALLGPFAAWRIIRACKPAARIFL